LFHNSAAVNRLIDAVMTGANRIDGVSVGDHELDCRAIGAILSILKLMRGTSTRTGKAFRNMLGVFAQVRNGDTQRRQLGINRAGANGIHQGWKPASTRALA
jgi:hypothetical protein